VALEFTDECMEKPGQGNEDFQGFSQTSTLLPQMKGGTEKRESRHFGDMSATRTHGAVRSGKKRFLPNQPDPLPKNRVLLKGMASAVP
jgi:hypothetical protein